MHYLGAGLSKTGTTSLHQAFQILGLQSIHWDTERLNDILDGSCTKPDFRRYDDVDAVTDLPSAFFWQELLVAYPEAKIILTVRNEDEWWQSIYHHFNIIRPSYPPKVPMVEKSLPSLSIYQKIKKRRLKAKEQHLDEIRSRIRILAYGSDVAIKYLYRKSFREHNNHVIRDVPPDKLLIMNIAAGDGWKKLCPFLGKPIPACPFPQARPIPNK